MKLIKFGGKSLANGKGIQAVISIIKNKILAKEKILVVVSARGKTTDDLGRLLALAKANKSYQKQFEAFKKYQLEPVENLDLDTEFSIISRLLEQTVLTKNYSLKTKDLLLAQGELISAKTIATILTNLGINSENIDSRLFLKTDTNFGNANIHNFLSEKNTLHYFKNRKENAIPIITGFIASDIENNTSTLGRNGTNYTASLIANYLNISIIESYTHVDGIFTANPELVTNAKIIKHINYNEASQLSNFGASIIHNKSIFPLMSKNIALRILNTFNLENEGTLISNKTNQQGIKSVSVQDDVSLINLTGKNLLGKIGIDARIFSKLTKHNINVGIISQGSSERDISFVVPEEHKNLAEKALKEEFEHELLIKDIQNISIIEDISVVTVTGQRIGDFSSSLDYLKQNKIDILLVNNTISESNISLMIKKKDTKKAVNVIHSQIFGAIKTINIAVVGKGTVGGSLINQILKSKSKILAKKNLHLNIFAIADSKKILLNKNDISENWQSDFDIQNISKHHEKTIIKFAKKNHLENLIVIDNTSSEKFVNNYIDFIENGFDIISSNKIANTQQYSKYLKLRKSLKNNNKQYLYETNVGAGLPIIDTIRILHESGENITRIKGVFSGSLSYLFNSFSTSDKPFSYFLKKAIEQGYTEPDPREDLSGNDVARKLLILARELDLENEFDEIAIENLIPKELRSTDTKQFLDEIENIDEQYIRIKKNLEKGKVLRYIGDLSGNLQDKKGTLKVKLVSVDSNSALGNLKGSDSIFEIYTESYKENPITIIGAGAGAEVTARGVFGDLLRIADKK